MPLHGLDKSISWYLAGPMSWVPQFNFPLFDAVSAALRKSGYIIVSPSELDSPAMRAAALLSVDGNPDALTKIEGCQTWGQVLGRDVTVVADQVGGIIFLPEWWKSRGARLEATAALLCGKQFGMWLDAGIARPYQKSSVVVRLVEWLRREASS